MAQLNLKGTEWFACPDNIELLDVILRPASVVLQAVAIIVTKIVIQERWYVEIFTLQILM